ncbi:unnamed protein product [Vitrella brassicaformis CCMP3155]|uniref:Alpha-1,4 glucan phosphorylase n=1 Tax=Vitrella brassicaformis (strain CCMP3155) TaxID=1169540 RepID=A0A0G4H454_VITBC|nr:unnamed protein product [Vitrella brassicaformis CCMP3155]|mmetsp:Transcript_42557/g.106217  ORF Transcript_42557/g.106217 Transcript_42557/m.106217 type:complete len:935 (-) Transcript_42557:1575-4379(-)|eukprot:CEM38533.1 unnamed protein product [Vitrella brassicaformis CCMP3155]
MAFDPHADHNFEMMRKASFSKLTGAVPRDMAGMHQKDFDPNADAKRNKIWQLMEYYLGPDVGSIQRGIVNHVEYTLAATRFSFATEECYRATAFSIRDRLIETFNDTNEFFTAKDVKRCYYLSLEFLLGRAMQNALVNLDIEPNYKKALADIGYNLEELYEHEHDPALGNGGLGRLAACFLDSMATLNYAVWGYGIRYTYGIFEQKIVEGRQVEHPDYWLVTANPWEIERPDVTYAVRFYGHVDTYKDDKGRERHRWTGGEIVQAMAYDNPIPGFDTYNTINLRLWKACPGKEFDFHAFNRGQFLDAVKERQRAEYISAVLYPNDNTWEGKELRLKQQYFFVCATIQDCLRRFKKKEGRSWDELPSKVCFQLNDTHPTIAIPEMMRLLIDIEGLDWDKAWDLTRQCFNYTNHTVLPEALEKWPAHLIEKLLPRHLLLINDINYKFLCEVRESWGDVGEKLSKMSIYQEGYEKMIRMANMAVIGSNKVNGVAAIHSELVKKDLFPEFVDYYKAKGQPDKFVNVTNGVTPRRWIHCANRGLSNLFSEWLGSDSWLKELTMLQGLVNHLDSTELQKQWADVKKQNKVKLTKWIKLNCDIDLDPENMLFDIQVKRIHEYKRQLINCFYIIHRYFKLKKMSPGDRDKQVKRACLIGGKAAPGYAVAKTIIKLCNNIGLVLNNDPDTSKYLKCVFMPNYNVSNAQTIIPASDISQHISTAGTEASGTSNMKFVMNGGLIVGTMDGANVEIREECGEDTMFIFGALEPEVAGIREKAKNGNYPISAELREVMDAIVSGKFSLGDGEAHSEFVGLIEKIRNNGGGYNGDFYILCHDFPSYCKANEQVDALYKDQTNWIKTSIKAAASMGKFTTDRSIKEYGQIIWKLEDAERPAPDQSPMARVRSFANFDPNAPKTATGAAPPGGAAPTAGTATNATEKAAA